MLKIKNLLKLLAILFSQLLLGAAVSVTTDIQMPQPHQLDYKDEQDLLIQAILKNQEDIVANRLKTISMKALCYPDSNNKTVLDYLNNSKLKNSFCHLFFDQHITFGKTIERLICLSKVKNICEYDDNDRDILKELNRIDSKIDFPIGRSPMVSGPFDTRRAYAGNAEIDSKYLAASKRNNINIFDNNPNGIVTDEERKIKIELCEKLKKKYTGITESTYFSGIQLFEAYQHYFLIKDKQLYDREPDKYYRRGTLPKEKLEPLAWEILAILQPELLEKYRKGACRDTSPFAATPAIAAASAASKEGN